MSLFSGIGDMLGGVFGGLFGTGSNTTSNSFLNTEGESGSPLSMITDPSGWWDNFKNGQATARNNKTNDTNKAIADDLNASNERIANATNDANIQMNEANNKTNLDIANATNQANLDIANQNINFQKETNAKNEQLMREQWAREDNAYSRTAQDMRNAGINPLAMSGTNGAGSVVTQTAPQNTATMQGATMNAGHVDPWTKVGWTADYNIANDLSDFGLLTQLAGTLSNLGGVAHQKQAQDKSANATDNALNETIRHNKAEENKILTGYRDVKNVVGEATSDIKGVIDAQGGVNKIVEKASDLAVDVANRIYDKSGIGNAVESAKNKVAEKQKEIELKKQSDAVAEYRKKLAEEKKQRFKEYKKQYYADPNYKAFGWEY